MNNRRRVLSVLLGGALALSLAACGGDSVTSPSPPTPTPTPTPGAAITASGNGAIVIHPSAAPAWTFALAMPVSIQETGGGTANWDYARLALFKGGAETERSEIGSDVIIDAGVGRLNPRGQIEETLVFRINSDDFDDIRLELGFTDVNRGTAMTADVPFDSFSDVAISVVPLAVPPRGKIELPRR